MPLVQKAGEGAWMRLGALDAGKNRGWVFRPELGDEVIAGFVDDDPRFGVVLGKLFSSKNSAPVPAKNENHLKGYTSRSGMVLQFDDENKIITASTPGGNMLTLDDKEASILLKDKHGNKIEMNKDGITIESNKELNLVSKADTTVKSNVNINIEATSRLVAKGTAGAELSAGGPTTVKGAPVQIN
jgi:uncharacterized protein involved in type VI secretion and phage assembly